MTDDQQWIKLFRYLDKRFREVDKRFEGVDIKFDKVYTMIDGLAKRMTDDEAERTAIVVQLNRHEGWLQLIANRLGLKFEH